MLKILGDVFIIASLLPWVNFGLNSQDTQVWPIIFGLAFLFSISKKIKVPPYFIIISFCFTLGFIFAVMNTGDYGSFLVIRAFAGYFGFLILMLGLYNYLTRFGFPINLFIIVNYLYLTMGITEVFYPEISEIFSSRRTTVDRGVTSLAPEPTFFAIYLLFSSWILLELKGFPIQRSYIYLVVILNVFAILFLAKSTMVIGFMMLGACVGLVTVMVSRFGLKKFSFLALSIFFMSAISVDFFSRFWVDTRPYILAASLLNSASVFGWLEMDASVSARVGSMYFSIVGAFYNGLIPGGFDSFLAMRADMQQLGGVQFNDPYASNVIMSWVGAVVFELGVFGLLAIGVFVYACYPRLNASVLKAPLLLGVLASAIPLGFPLVPLLFVTLVWMRRPWPCTRRSTVAGLYSGPSLNRLNY